MLAGVCRKSSATTSCSAASIVCGSQSAWLLKDMCILQKTIILCTHQYLARKYAWYAVNVDENDCSGPHAHRTASFLLKRVISCNRQYIACQSIWHTKVRYILLLGCLSQHRLPLWCLTARMSLFPFYILRKRVVSCICQYFARHIKDKSSSYNALAETGANRFPVRTKLLPTQTVSRMAAEPIRMTWYCSRRLSFCKHNSKL